jgi:hypothetical protein
MTLMMGKLYAALKAANAPETEAREAAEEAASVLNRFDSLDRGLDGVNARIDLVNARIDLVNSRIDLLRTEVKGEIRRLEWMVAGLLAVALAVAGRLFLHG